MKRYWAAPLLAVIGMLALSLDGDACWRRRHCPPCFQYGPEWMQGRSGMVVRRYDKRLETDKRNIPEYTEIAPFGTPAFIEPDGDTYTVPKHDRGRAKTRFANAPTEPLTDLRSLILSLPDDEQMIPLISKNWDFDRIGPEQRNVRVVGYLFAIAKESDNDFHLIIDDDGDLEEGAKLNVEVTGIPTEGPNIDDLQAVRDQFKAHFDGGPPTKYKPFLDPPLRVIIEGSLFYDVDHPPGTVGPQGYRPASAWEIHPVRSIQFLQN
jgi:hypothetical protein